jgi:pimeloyl-ACP methyl ester carboxylesterase
LLVIKNSGHVVNVEQPKTFNAETIQFIKALA